MLDNFGWQEDRVCSLCAPNLDSSIKGFSLTEFLLVGPWFTRTLNSKEHGCQGRWFCWYLSVSRAQNSLCFSHVLWMTKTASSRNNLTFAGWWRTTAAAIAPFSWTPWLYITNLPGGVLCTLPLLSLGVSNWELYFVVIHTGQRTLPHQTSAIWRCIIRIHGSCGSLSSSPRVRR